jgi:ATP-dependent DNA helicase RecG
VIAFANTDGGTLYIGVEDEGAVCGLEDADGTLLRASNASAMRSVRRDPFTECRTLVLGREAGGAIDIQRRGRRGRITWRTKGSVPRGVRAAGCLYCSGAETAILA